MRALANTAVFTLRAIAAQYTIGLALAVLFHCAFLGGAARFGAVAAPFDRFCFHLVVDAQQRQRIVNAFLAAFGTGQPGFSPAAAVGNLLILIAFAAGLAHVRLQRKEAIA